MEATTRDVEVPVRRVCQAAAHQIPLALAVGGVRRGGPTAARPVALRPCWVDRALVIGTQQRRLRLDLWRRTLSWMSSLRSSGRR